MENPCRKHSTRDPVTLGLLGQKSKNKAQCTEERVPEEDLFERSASPNPLAGQGGGEVLSSPPVLARRGMFHATTQRTCYLFLTPRGVED